MRGKADPVGEKSIFFLSAVNNVLKNTPFELAFRALNELLLHVSSFAPGDDAELQAVWDDFLMTKVLPRIDGDEDKLRIAADTGTANLLDVLELQPLFLMASLNDIKQRLITVPLNH